MLTSNKSLNQNELIEVKKVLFGTLRLPAVVLVFLLALSVCVHSISVLPDVILPAFFIAAIVHCLVIAAFSPLVGLVEITFIVLCMQIPFVKHFLTLLH